MPASTRLGDIGSGHACHFPPTPSIEASPDVNIDGIPAVRQGDAYAPHACPSCPAPAHGRTLAGGSGSVFINGKPAGSVHWVRIGSNLPDSAPQSNARSEGTVR